MQITLTTTDNQKNNTNTNMTSIDLGDCDIALRKHYNISDDKVLYMRKIDINQTGFKIPKIEYDVYCKLNGSNLIKLALSVCSNTKVDIYIPIVIEENLDKLNTSSGYFNDICYVASSDIGTDISLKDRKNEYINGKKAVCQDDCDFSKYDYKRNKAKCSCKVKKSSDSTGDMVIDIDKLFKNFMNIKNIANINLMKCTNVLFNKEGISSNIGFYITAIIIVFDVITVIFFYSNKQCAIEYKINKIISAKKKKNNSIYKKNKKIKKHKKGNNPPIKTKKVRQIKIRKNNNNNKIYNIININSYKKELTNISINNSKQITKKESDNNKKLKSIMEYTDDEMNLLIYKLALEYDKRTFSMYYCSLLRTKHILIFTFFYNNDYNSKIIKIDLFLIGFVLYYAVNAFFFNDDTMHEIYQRNGKFNLEYQIPQIIYSSIISGIITFLLKLLAISNDAIINFKQNKSKANIQQNAASLKTQLNIKFISFFIVGFEFLLFFWYYLSMFSAIYRNTQIHLIYDTLISFGLSLIYPLGIYLLPGLFRIPALKDPKKNRSYLYKISRMLQLL